jgi:glycerol-3-phosphate O-acyltransferase / dihydroxyacetone phosphate acyltransferase
MIHFILRFLLNVTFWIFYRKMSIKGIENVPATGPVILACNHPNSFLDALVVGIFQSRRMYFLARADVFNTPLKNWILTQMSLLPVFRLQEGMENLDKNKDTFSRCHELFDKGGMILIFSEGLCIQEMRLRPLKKGTARIALDYVKDGKSLMIVPIGLNYPKPMKAREEVMLIGSRPFNAADLAGEYAANPAKAINTFNKQLEEGLRESVIDIRDKHREKEITQLVEVTRNEGYSITELVDLAKKLHILSQATPDRYTALVTNLHRYRQVLEKNGIEDSIVRDTKQHSLLTWLFAPIFYLGFWINSLPLATARWLAKTKVRHVEFYDSVLVGAFMFLSVIHHLFIFLILLFVHPVLALLVPGVLLVLGAVSTSLHDILKRNKLRLIRSRMPADELSALRNLRKEIVELSPR